MRKVYHILRNFVEQMLHLLRAIYLHRVNRGGVLAGRRNLTSWGRGGNGVGVRVTELDCGR
jgi:hypothetical protein